MRAFARVSEAAAALALSAGAALAEAPARVASVNLCTDQMLLLLAEPDQIAALSPLATGADGVREAGAYPSVPAQAEAVYLLSPDLVLAGTFTAPATVEMMRRVGLRVEQFAPATSLAGIAENLRRMGALLGREDRAEALARPLEDAGPADADGPRAALYGPNGWLQGRETLAGEIVARAGFRVAGDTPYGGFVALEDLVMSAPDVLIRGAPNRGTSRGDALLDHPALDDFETTEPLIDRDWTCGTPRVLDAIARLTAVRDGLD